MFSSLKDFHLSTTTPSYPGYATVVFPFCHFLWLFWGSCVATDISSVWKVFLLIVFPLTASTQTVCFHISAKSTGLAFFFLCSLSSLVFALYQRGYMMCFVLVFIFHFHYDVSVAFVDSCHTVYSAAQCFNSCLVINGWPGHFFRGCYKFSCFIHACTFYVSGIY